MNALPALVPPKWTHGRDDWTFDPALGIYVGPPEPVHGGARSYCLGDRFVHPGSGVRTGDVVFVGSRSTDWHGGCQTRDLAQAILWVQSADFREAGCGLWSRRQDADRLGAAIVAANRRAGQLGRR